MSSPTGTAQVEHGDQESADRDRVYPTLHWDGPISAQAERRGLDRPLDLAPWLELHEPDTVLC
ncbi:hypothetical protein [Streptomyces geranii]|uniref:hypothetical protein n=1 Tax=Streptomyces geranii TaxID=2058923 RepID=UPI000D0347ED|nr:hypothetical protein [Streptomyces geranii]